MNDEWTGACAREHFAIHVFYAVNVRASPVTPVNPS